MQKVIIVGGGFGGLSAAGVFAKARGEVEVTLVDQRESCDFLPMLPDVLGRGVPVSCLRYNLQDAAARLNFKFVNRHVESIDTSRKEVLTSGGALGYDYLIVASGSETNFYNNENIRQGAFRLDDTIDAARIISAIKAKEFSNYVIAGGGYTGIEVATNLSIFLRRHRREGKIIIIERATSILGTLPQWTKDYASNNLERLGIEVILNASIDRIENGRIFISTGAVLESSMLIWCAGVRTGDFLQRPGFRMNSQGRIKVDKYLRLNGSCFIIGDACHFSSGDAFLRMAVQFSLAQGRCAARNVLRSIRNRPLIEYRPFDFGYIIPMANNQSCGIVLGTRVKGLLPTLFHYIMCIYRSYGFRNRWGVLRSLSTGGVG